MCGIVGLIAKSNTMGFTYKHKNMFEQLLYIDALRGPDSTGAYFVNKHGNVKWAKKASMSAEFLNHTGGKNLLSDATYNTTIMVGHNRKATFGTVNDENAHPFIEEDIILVHNGTLRNHKTLNKDVAVDSHAIAHAIKDHGIHKAISKIEGAFAVAAYDVTKKHFYLFRNDDRPMWLAESDNAWIFASEPWMIFGVGWRNELKMKQPIQIESSKLYTFDITENQVTLSERKVKLYTPPKIVAPKTTAVTVAPKVAANTTQTVVKSPFDKKGGTGADIIDLVTRFSKDEIICFTPKNLIMKGDQNYNKIEGAHYKYPQIKVVAFVDGTPGYIKHLYESELLVGEVTSVNADSALNHATIYVRHITKSDGIMTINGTTINEEQMMKVSGKCSQCGDMIEEDDIGASFFKEKGEIIKHYCPMCVMKNTAQNPAWGGMNNIVAQAH